MDKSFRWESRPPGGSGHEKRKRQEGHEEEDTEEGKRESTPRTIERRDRIGRTPPRMRNLSWGTASEGEEEGRQQEKRARRDEQKRPMAQINEVLASTMGAISSILERSFGDKDDGSEDQREEMEDMGEDEEGLWKGKESGSAGVRESLMTKVEEQIKGIEGAISRVSGNKIQFNKGEQEKVKACLGGIMGAMREWERKESARREKEIRDGEKIQWLTAKSCFLEGRLRVLEEAMTGISDIRRDIWDLKEAMGGSKQGKGWTSREDRGVNRVNERERNERGERKERMVIESTGEEMGGETTDRGEKGNEAFQMVKRKRKKARAKTYAETIAGNWGRRNVGEQERDKENKGEGWKTPERNEMYEVKVKGGMEPKVMEKIKERVRVEKVGALDGMIKLANGDVVLKCKDGGQKGKLVDALKNGGVDGVHEGTDKEPMLQICGLEKGIADAEIVRMLAAENEEVKKVMNRKGIKEEDIKVRFRRKCRDERKENVIVSMDAELFKLIVKKGKMVMDLTYTWVEEYVDVAICFRCCRFGHTAKNCKDEVACHKCAGAHDGRTCREEAELECVNCRRLGLAERCHGARDTKSPVYKRKQGQYRDLINYG